MINKRFIVPYITRPDYSPYTIELRYGGYADDIEDIIRALCYITGTPYDMTVNLKEFIRENDIAWGQWEDMLLNDVFQGDAELLYIDTYLTDLFKFV